MNWNELLSLPATMLLALAALAVMLALLQAFAVRRRLREGHHFAAGIRVLIALVALALGLLFGGTAAVLRGYRFLGGELPVATIDARALAPQRWQVTLALPDGTTRQVSLAGDEFRIEAVVLKWKLPAVLAGVPPLYRLDRLEGRYDDPRQEADAPRTVIALGRGHRFDPVDLRNRHVR